MAKRRANDFDLRTVMARRDFTPGRSDVPSLLAIVTDDDEASARDATIALSRVPVLAMSVLTSVYATMTTTARARVPRMLTRFPNDLVRAHLCASLSDEASIVRRASAQALARVGGEGVEDALLARFPAEDPAETRAIAMALGRTGGEASVRALAGLDATGDDELGRIVERARLMLGRASSRTEESSLDASAALAELVPITLLCRAGLESTLTASLRDVKTVRDIRQAGRGAVTARFSGSPRALDDVRTFYELGFPLPTRIAEASLADDVSRALTTPLARTLLTTFTRGVPRVRVAFEDGRKRRASAWKIAAALEAVGIVNDPIDATWQARIAQAREGAMSITLVPRGLCDGRFAYRVADVPASTHPTIAAAMARLCPMGSHEIIWDPFMGAGVELIERARLGPYAQLFGTDVSEDALTAARANLTSANVHAELSLADATRVRPARAPTTIITNPPMGRRVSRGEAGDVLDAFVAHLGEVASPRATLVWLAPMPKRTSPLLDAAGFRLESSLRIDMGGFDVSLERRRRGPSP